MASEVAHFLQRPSVLESNEHEETVHVLRRANREVSPQPLTRVLDVSVARLVSFVLPQPPKHVGVLQQRPRATDGGQAAAVHLVSEFVDVLHRELSWVQQLFREALRDGALPEVQTTKELLYGVSQDGVQAHGSRAEGAVLERGKAPLVVQR
eukprot:CAMPEP_0171984836 /NCGR_PEP_ID=MMETSP0993-20121228/274036_1 /TAXON_ID=483369 /ORGANISM="non described non described, Strain CCMP2098" /LENGTH=151 /DNA_ID=CAMNT_0012637675 /DNA_START=825 /DNA_END=1280 /DNA_ORIENTATION=+